MLIDPGSTCSFISDEFALKGHSAIESLEHDICVFMSIGGIINVNRVVNHFQ